MISYNITISNGILKDQHRKRMGIAIWEFIWCLDKVTKIDEKGNGYVLGGKPVNLKDIADDLDLSEDTISRNLDALHGEGYIEKTRTPNGLSIKVFKAKKIFQKGNRKNADSAEMPVPDRRSAESETAEVRIPDRRSAVCNKDNTEIRQLDKTEIQEAGEPAGNVAYFINLFSSVNPSYRRLFPNKTQRAALERLLRVNGSEQLEKIIKFLPLSNKEKFAPTITTPLQLEDKLGALISFAQKQKQLVPKRKIVL